MQWQHPSATDDRDDGITGERKPQIFLQQNRFQWTWVSSSWIKLSHNEQGCWAGTSSRLSSSRSFALKWWWCNTSTLSEVIYAIRFGSDNKAQADRSERSRLPRARTPPLSTPQHLRDPEPHIYAVFACERLLLLFLAWNTRPEGWERKGRTTVSTFSFFFFPPSDCADGGRCLAQRLGAKRYLRCTCGLGVSSLSPR